MLTAQVAIVKAEANETQKQYKYTKQNNILGRAI
jgi:hypothetical protein